MSEGLCRPGCRYNARARWTNYSLKQNCTSFWVSLYSSPSLDPVIPCPSHRDPKSHLRVSRCEQQYRLHRLLAFDPNNECRGNNITVFYASRAGMHLSQAKMQKPTIPTQLSLRPGIFSDWFSFPSFCLCKCYGAREVLQVIFKNILLRKKGLSLQYVCPTGKERPEEV